MLVFYIQYRDWGLFQKNARFSHLHKLLDWREKNADKSANELMEYHLEIFN